MRHETQELIRACIKLQAAALLWDTGDIDMQDRALRDLNRAGFEFGNARNQMRKTTESRRRGPDVRMML